MDADVRLHRSGDGRLSRRRFFGGGAALGLAAAGLVACSSTNKNSAAKPAATTAPAAAGSVPAAAATRTGTPAPAAASRTATPAALDSTKGKPGGTLKLMLAAAPASLSATDVSNTFNELGYIFSSLLAPRWGQQSVPYTDYSFEPDLATAMPEQPDQTTYVYKLRPGVKFHNGRALTSDDVKYSYDLYTNRPTSAFSAQWKAWYDHTETPDPLTVVVKSQFPYAGGVEATAGNTDGYILAKENAESPDFLTKPVGSGPFVFSDAQPPVSFTVKKNSDYYLKPYPYFDQIQMFATTDTVARLTNFTTKQVQMPWLVYIAERDQVLQQRPDAKVVNIDPYTASAVFMRTDKAPFNDARVRQALSMAIDRAAIKNTVNKGQGENDQFFSLMYQELLGTSRPKDLGDGAKYWNYDVQTAKQLMAAAGVTGPIELPMNHYDASVVGQWFPDLATLIQAQWKQAGIANIKDNAQVAGAYSSTTNLGQYDGFDVSIKTGIQQGFQHGSVIRAALYWGPNGEHSPRNNSYINDPQISPLADKQFRQLKADEQKQTYRQIEPILAAQQYLIELTTSAQYWPYDPALTNMNMSGEQASRRYAMRWWLA